MHATKRESFHGLDALRGIAAACIIVHHCAGFVHGPDLPSAFLAVDFFFQLSGFVLAYAYEDAFARGLTTTGFVVLRLIRLYPLYILGTLIATFAILKSFAGGDNGSLGPYGLALLNPLAPLASFPLTAVLLPTPLPFYRGYLPLYPLNCPAWSLFFELLVNSAYRAIFLQLRRTALVAILVVAGLGLALGTMRANDMNFGGNMGEFAFGCARVMFSFFIGVGLYRVRTAMPAAVQTAAWVPLLILGGVLCSGVPAGRRALYDLTMVFVIFPAIVLVASRNVYTGRSARVCDMLGSTSYAMYVMHMPLVILIMAFLPIADRPILQQYGGLWIALFIPLLFALCAWLDRAYDIPVRRLLTRRFAPSRLLR